LYGLHHQAPTNYGVTCATTGNCSKGVGGKSRLATPGKLPPGGMKGST
jgi:hypothetical protein